MSWDIDLKFGKDRENAFANLLSEVGGRIECKSDRLFAKYGNLAMEFEQEHADGVVRPSGVFKPSDNFAIEFLPHRWLVVPTEFARKVTTERHHKITWGGDGNKAHLALVKPNVFFIP